MIGGYILPIKNQAFESVCKKRYSSHLKEYALEVKDQYCWCFSSDSSEKKHNFYFDGSSLLLLSGFAAIGISGGGYREYDAHTDFKPDSPKAFIGCINSIVSNVNAIYVEKGETQLRLNIASYRVCGRPDMVLPNTR